MVFDIKLVLAWFVSVNLELLAHGLERAVISLIIRITGVRKERGQLRYPICQLPIPLLLVRLNDFVLYFNLPLNPRGQVTSLGCIFVLDQTGLNVNCLWVNVLTAAQFNAMNPHASLILLFTSKYVLSVANNRPWSDSSIIILNGWEPIFLKYPFHQALCHS